jgi:hypothetical protein
MCEVRGAYTVLLGDLRGRNYSENIGVDWTVVLKQIF